MNKFNKSRKFSVDNYIENMKFNFCGNLKWLLIAPVAIILVGVILLSTIGFNLGIDFTGGSNVTVYAGGEYGSKYNVDKDSQKIEDTISDVLKKYDLKIATYQKTTMTIEFDGEESEGVSAVIVKYQNGDISSDEIERRDKEIRLDLLKAFGFVDESVTLDNLDDEENSQLVSTGGMTSATASSELMMKSFISLFVALILILIYIIFRFQWTSGFTSGLVAILALVHDVLVTASVVLIFRIEINVSFIAALITILGYSINNTIIIFDRMRDMLRTSYSAGLHIDNVSVANSAVKATMMRSILTTLTTFVMIFMISIIGVSDIKEFAFPIMIGIVAGFYSSVFLTPGLWAIAYRPRTKRAKKKEEPVEEETGVDDVYVEKTKKDEKDDEL